jgi:ribosomal-protein-serine acetyltransferase
MSDRRRRHSSNSQARRMTGSMGSGPATEPVRLTLPGGQTLRVLEVSDADELYALIDANRSHLARWMPWAAGQTLEGTLEFIRAAGSRLAEGNGFQAAIVDGGRIVGVIGFHGIDWLHHSTSLGYWLAEDAQGQGTMTTAVRAMLGHALLGLGLNRVEIRASVENARSRALIERLGFHYEGVAREAFRLADGYHDDAVYSMLAAEWRAHAAPAAAERRS